MSQWQLYRQIQLDIITSHDPAEFCSLAYTVHVPKQKAQYVQQKHFR